jgi:hypothetical protein
MVNGADTSSLNAEALNLEDELELDAFHDAWIAAGKAKVQDDFRRLRQLGIVDEDGKQLKVLIPADMRDTDTDFGG